MTMTLTMRSVVFKVGFLKCVEKSDRVMRDGNTWCVISVMKFQRKKKEGLQGIIKTFSMSWLIENFPKFCSSRTPIMLQCNKTVVSGFELANTTQKHFYCNL